MRLRPAFLAALTLAVSALPALPAAAATPKARIVDRTLVVDGTAGADAITLRLGKLNPLVVEVDTDGDPAAEFVFLRLTFDRITVRLGDGDDRARVDDTRGAFTLTEKTTLEGGAGADQLTGGAGAETFLAGAGDDLVDGGRGADIARLGDGSDVLQWDGGDGNDVVEGEAGFDAVRATGSTADERIALSRNGDRVRLTHDAGRTALDLGGIERVEAALLDGQDRLDLADLGGTELQELRVNLSRIQGVNTPDTRPDVVTVAGSPAADHVDVIESGGLVSLIGGSAFVQITGPSAADTLQLNGGDGDDRIGASSLKAGTIGFTATGDDGDDVLSGGQGGDSLTGGNGEDFVTGGPGNDSVAMGTGDDIFTWRPGDGDDVVKGEAGADAANLSGSSASERFGFGPNGAGGAAVTRDVDSVRTSLDGVETVSTFSFGGSDTFAVGDLAGTGVQTIDASLFDFAVPGGNTDVVSLTGTAADDKVLASTANGVATVTGLAAKVRLTGTDAAGDRLEIGTLGGKDTIDTTAVEAAELQVRGDGGAGDDVLLGGKGDDVLVGGDGADVVFAGSGDNVALGSAGDDVLRGEEGDDVLDGGPDDDILIGGPGDDVLLNGEVVFDD